MTASPFVFIGGTSEPGGLHVHTADLAQAIAALGHPVHILCPSVDHFSAMFADRSVCVTVIPERRPDELPWSYWRCHLAPHRHATAILVRGKLGESSPLDPPAIRLACRRLFTVEHRDFDRPWSDRSPPWFHGWLMRAAVSGTIAVSNEIADSAVGILKLPRDRVQVCPNWVDPAYRPTTPEERAAAKRRLDLPPDALVVGYHGRFAPEKRVPELVDAFASLDTRAYLVLVGDGWKRGEIERRAAECGLGSRVVFTGWHPDPASAVAAFDISVLPSLFEGFPLGLLEAMASGAACLAHPMSSARTVVESGVNGLLADLSDGAMFAAALRSLVEMPRPAREAMGARAAETVRTHFSRARRLPAVLRALGFQSLGKMSDDFPIVGRNLVFARPPP